MKKINIVLLTGLMLMLIFILSACNGVIPDPDPDPDPNPDNQRVVLVEAYTVQGCSGCVKIGPILEQLAQEYSREEMVLVQLDPWSDYSFSKTLQRLKWYGLPTKVPQVTFNGLNGNLLGASSYSVIKSKIEVQRKAPLLVNLEATRTATPDGIEINGTVKNIGNKTLTDLVVNGMTFTDREKPGFHYSVTNIFDDEKVVISSLVPGGEKNFTINIGKTSWTSDHDGVIFVQAVADSKKNILQSVFLN